MEKNTLKWKKELPTAPGWYWRRMQSHMTGIEIAVVQVRDYAGELAIGNAYLAGWNAMLDAEWAGPIQEPTD